MKAEAGDFETDNVFASAFLNSYMNVCPSFGPFAPVRAP